MRRRAAIAFALLCALVGAPAFAYDCHVRNGTRVVLYGTLDDPDVLVWDSNLRLKKYGVATFDESQLLLPHALVAPPGTRAVVTACRARIVTTKFSTTVEDAIQVAIQDGPLRGHSGWIGESAMRFPQLRR